MSFDSHKFIQDISKYRYKLNKLKTFSVDEIKKFDMLEDFLPPEEENEIMNE